MYLGWEHPKRTMEELLYKLLAANETTLYISFTQDYCDTNFLITIISFSVECNK